MAEPKQRIAASKLLLARGMRFTITDAPWYWKLLRFDRITISHLRAGTIAEISMIIDSYGLDDVRLAKETNIKMTAVARVIAVAILNNETRIRRYSLRLTKLLLWKIPAQTLIDIFYVIAAINKLSDFTHITAYFSHQAQMMMSPKNTGQTMTKGS